MSELRHLDEAGAARMVDVSHKPDSVRSASATGVIEMQETTLRLVERNAVAKGDVLAVARVAGIMAAKRTSDLVPLCHPLPLTGVDVEIAPDGALTGLRVTATVRCTGPTGVEMEALAAVTASLLTIYDMTKGVDRSLRMGYIEVLSKNGGTSGPWQRA